MKASKSMTLLKNIHYLNNIDYKSKSVKRTLWQSVIGYSVYILTQGPKDYSNSMFCVEDLRALVPLTTDALHMSNWKSGQDLKRRGFGYCINLRRAKGVRKNELNYHDITADNASVHGIMLQK